MLNFCWNTTVTFILLLTSLVSGARRTLMALSVYFDGYNLAFFSCFLYWCSFCTWTICEKVFGCVMVVNFLAYICVPVKKIVMVMVMVMRIAMMITTTTTTTRMVRAFLWYLVKVLLPHCLFACLCLCLRLWARDQKFREAHVYLYRNDCPQPTHSRNRRILGQE